MMTTEFRLKVFCSVAHNLSYTKAAQELYISQPAISKHIQELETQFKTRLFERLGNKIVLTPSGKLLRDHSEKILNDYSQLEFEMNQLNDTHQGDLRIGASTTIAQYVLPPLLAKFVERFPDVNVTLISGNSNAIEQAMMDHQIDVGLVENASRQPGLRYLKFMDDELVLIASTHGDYALTEELSLDALKSVPLVLRELGSGTLDIFKRALERHTLKLQDLNIRLHLGSSEGIKSFVENTSCLGILSCRCINREVMSGQLHIVELPELSMNREFCILQPQGESTGLPEVFITFLERNAK